MSENLQVPEGCLPFDLQQFADNGGTTGAFDVVFVRQHQSEPDWTLVKPVGKSDFQWWVDRSGKFVAWHAHGEMPVNAKTAGNVYCKPKRISELNPMVFQEVRMDPPTAHGAFHPAPEPTITASLWLDADGQRKITVTAPLSVTRAELERIQAWLGWQLLVEGT